MDGVKKLKQCVRYATLDDYDAVMAIDDNIYEGADYLPVLYEEFIRDPLTRSYLLEIDNTVVAFCATTVVNGGKTLLGRAGRIDKKYRAKGYYKEFVAISVADMRYHFPESEMYLSMSKTGFGNINQLVHFMTQDKYEVLQLVGKITLQCVAEEISSSIFETSGDGHFIRLVNESEFIPVMENNKELLEPFVQLSKQPYELTSDNFRYIADRVKPVCFLSNRFGLNRANSTVATGMSFHTSFPLKIGHVIFNSYKLSSSIDFELHFKAHLRYIMENLVTTRQEKIHLFILFPTNLRFGEVLHIGYKYNLKPGIRDEGFQVVFKENNYHLGAHAKL